MELFNISVLENSKEDLVRDLNELLEEVSPKGKTVKNFTGGYIQQLKNSNQLVAYFGTKEGTNNRDTVKITIDADELDLFYVMLKAKIHSMRNDKAKVVKVSMAQRKLDKAKKEEDWE